MTNFHRQPLPDDGFVTTTGNIAKDGLLVVGCPVDDNEGHLLGPGYAVWGISGFVGSPSHTVRILFYEPDNDRQAVLDDYYEAEKADAQSGREEEEEDDGA